MVSYKIPSLNHWIEGEFLQDAVDHVLRIAKRYRSGQVILNEYTYLNQTRKSIYTFSHLKKKIAKSFSIQIFINCIDYEDTIRIA